MNNETLKKKNDDAKYNKSVDEFAKLQLINSPTMKLEMLIKQYESSESKQDKADALSLIFNETRFLVVEGCRIRHEEDFDDIIGMVNEIERGLLAARSLVDDGFVANN